MANYDRYKEETAQTYEKKCLMDYLVRIPSDRKLMPFLSQIKDKKILDVGLGSGRYTKLLFKDNEITGIDQNPHLCSLPIKVLQGDATNLGQLVESKNFDVVFSTWMTEYLSPGQLRAFFKQAKEVLNGKGQLITTIISKCGFGFLYITAARTIRKTDKHNYRKKEVINLLKEAGFKDIKIINLSSWLYVPWAYLVIAR